MTFFKGFLIIHAMIFYFVNITNYTICTIEVGQSNHSTESFNHVKI